jgi:hypothetical protein
MRRVFWSGLAVIALAVGAYSTIVQLARQPEDPVALRAPVHRDTGGPVAIIRTGSSGHDLDPLAFAAPELIVVERTGEEPSSVEPGIVDDSMLTFKFGTMPTAYNGPTYTLVVPDTGSDVRARMPYADECGDYEVGWTSRLLRLQSMPDAGDEEASENRDNPAPTVEPPSDEQPTTPTVDPNMDYHHHHMSCPYTGRCPYPYHYPRAMPTPPPQTQEPK